MFSFSWEQGSWSECSAECGGGTQQRTVRCKRNDGTYWPDSVCSSVGTKPETTQSCNTQSCGNCYYCYNNKNNPECRLDKYWLRFVKINDVSFCKYVKPDATPTLVTIIWNNLPIYAPGADPTVTEFVDTYGGTGKRYWMGDLQYRDYSSENSACTFYFSICRE